MSQRSGSRLRPLAAPRPARVLVRNVVSGDAVPAAVREGRRWRRVDAVQESWRIDDEWWRRCVSRVYHRVVLDHGGLRTLYQDQEGGGWYLHG
jgi:hypothetical protein